MTGPGRAQQSGTHRSIRFLITEDETAGAWRYSFSIGNRNFAGKIQAVLGLLAARRVKMKIDRVLRLDALMKAHADAVVEPGADRSPIAPSPAVRRASASGERLEKDVEPRPPLSPPTDHED
ncbi:hypothetical protein [Bradyrhizobium ivorense]|uniref:hypothetical protein n=1 Tax=Bradyrhizobium ivorense TaxID=2511166 RepID=UPI0010B96986|nr:hypothetical protein [Bradyrhizobium ivorense]MCC8941017.1 hypothetical protein [Bradyrhizobium ivorense]VIO79993.1 hypothetical protein CI41S_69520 [Bradyrhizobium ivorense]